MVFRVRAFRLKDGGSRVEVWASGLEFQGCRFQGLGFFGRLGGVGGSLVTNVLVPVDVAPEALPHVAGTG